MKMPMKVDEYGAWVMTRLHNHDNDSLVTIGVLGIAGEAGEVTEIFKKNLDRGRPIDREKLKLELGDLLFYIVMTGGLLGITLQEIIDGNHEKLIARDGANNERWGERK